jgi:hypothetical protein
MDVSGGVDAENRNIIMYTKHGKINQQWDLVYTDEWKGEPGKGELNEDFGFYVNRPFYFRSRLPMKRVAEMQGGTQVYLKRWVKNKKQQQWFFDPVAKVIKNNYWKNYVLNIPSNGNANSINTVSSITSRWWQLFRYEGAFVTNEKGKVMDVSGGVDTENRNIIAYKKHGGVN